VVAKALAKRTATPAKSPAKPLAKTAVKAGAKAGVLAKAPSQSVKKAIKAVAKAPAKSAAKSAVKPASKAVPTKAAAKVAKPVKAVKAVKAPTKSIAKPAAKAVVKPVVQAASKAPVKAPAKKAAQTLAPAPAKAVTLTPPKEVDVPAAKRSKGKTSGSSKFIVPSSTFENPPKIEMTTRSTVAAAVPSPIKKNPKLANNWKSKSPAELSDEEVIAMPDGEYMNEAQLAFFRLRLVALKNNILANAGETTVNLKEDSSIVPDPADRATIEEEHALELRTRDRERKLLKKIEQSIARIDSDDYGYCDETGEPIGVPRLLARPTAALSLEAQTRRELKQKMFGD
jgi:DnaK suppressor protein